MLIMQKFCFGTWNKAVFAYLPYRNIFVSKIRNQISVYLLNKTKDAQQYSFDESTVGHRSGCNIPLLGINIRGNQSDILFLA